MKTRILPILSAVSLLAMLGGWSVAAPAPEAGRPQEIASFQAHPNDVQGLTFSPDGKMLATAGHEGKVKVWDVTSWENLLNLKAHQDGRGPRIAEAVAFSPDGKTLASAGHNRKVNLWNLATGKNIDTFPAIPGQPLLFSPDGKSLVASYELFDLETKKARTLVTDPKAGIHPVVVFTPKGKLLVALTDIDSHSSAVWDVESGKKIFTRKCKREYPVCAAFSPDAKTVVSIEGELLGPWTIQLWDIASGKNIATFEQVEKPFDPTFRPDGKVFAVSSKPAPDRIDSGSVRLFEVSSGKVLAHLKGYKRLVNCLAFSPDGRMLATGTLDGVIKIWSIPKRFKDE